jgi:hypothetical protein
MRRLAAMKMKPWELRETRKVYARESVVPAEEQPLSTDGKGKQEKGGGTVMDAKVRVQGYATKEASNDIPELP